MYRPQCQEGFNLGVGDAICVALSPEGPFPHKKSAHRKVEIKRQLLAEGWPQSLVKASMQLSPIWPPVDSKSRRTAKLHGQFKCYKNVITLKKKSKTSNVGMGGVYPDAIDRNIGLHTHILFWASISEVGSQKHFKKWGHFFFSFFF